VLIGLFNTVGQNTKIPIQIRGIMAGATLSNVYLDGKRHASAFSLSSVGVNAEFLLKKKLYLGTQLVVSNQKSFFQPSVFVKQQVAQLLIGPSVKVDDIRFRAGLSLEYRTAPVLEARTTSLNTLQNPDVDPSTQVNLFLGTEFYLSPKFGLYLNGVLPLQSGNSSSFQLGLKYRLHSKPERKQSYLSRRKEMGKKDIILLKEGALLVRLQTSKNKIDALRKVGKEKQALKAEVFQQTENEKIMQAFVNQFDFAPVYFFYSHHSNKVRKGDFEGIFLNENLEVDSTIVMDKKMVYTSEYTSIKQDTFIQLSHYELKQTGNWQLDWVPRYYGQPAMGFKAIVINNQNFEQMAEPFPYYARTNAPGIKKHPEQLLFGFPLIYFLLNSSYDSAVEALNSKLNRYYLQSK